MATFEVTIDSPGARPLRLLVAAEHWVEAWQEGLCLIGDDPAPTDASCVLDDLVARIEVPSSGRSFVVRPQRGASADPVPERGRPIVMSRDGGQSPAITVRQKRLGALPEVVLEHRRATATPLPRQPVPPAEEDPVARVLSDLERQRLNARPLRIDRHGMPQPIAPPPRRQPTPQSVPRAGGSAEQRASERRTRDETLAFTPSAASAPLDQLPQLFRPVNQAESDDLDVPTARNAALQWAVDTAWQHVPCALALLLEALDTERPEVLYARGERERETRGCAVPLVHAFRQVACVAPTRVRFAEGASIRFVRPDDQSFDLAVQSTLCAPIAFVPGHASVTTSGLGLVLVNSTRPSGFTDSELRALTYLARTLAARLDEL